MIASKFIIAWSCMVGLQPPGQPAIQPPKAAFVARPLAVLTAPQDAPMVMPTAVAVAPSGSVFAADGANDRILEFDEAGNYVGSITTIENQPLSRPISLRVDSASTLWIADTGNNRILARDANGKLIRTIDAPADSDLTDVVLGENDILWLIDNDGHRIIRHDLKTGESSPYGKLGEARGQFQYPFMAALDPKGVLYVTDVINGRVQGIPDFNTIPRVVGSYGVESGQFHRPKGIAIDSDGRIIVADGSLEVIQFFAADGTFLDALRDDAGAVLHFDSPCGIALHGDTLYVTELLPGRVQKLRLVISAVQPRLEPPRRPQPQTQPPTCTACHLEWMPHFSAGAATDIAAVPKSRTDEHYVASAKSCATCHDGSITDSRKKVWLEHGHNIGISPPAGMTVPKEMPLVDGKLACRTCHSAHTHGGAGQTMKDAVFLRVSQHPDELCIRCHTDYKGDPGTGMHPTKGFTQPLHADLLAAGSRYSFQATSSGCLICHTGHGAKADRLLIPLASTDQMCASCHSSVTQAAPAHSHPLDAMLSSAQQSNVTTMGARLSPDGQLQCLSCHKVHHAKSTQSLLVRSPDGSAMCMECHADYQPVFGSSHDLAIHAPQEVNALGKTSETAGPCSACHAVHQPARAFIGEPADRSGKCVTCHQDGACAAQHTGSPFSHPIEVGSAWRAELAKFSGRRINQRDTNVALSNQLECADCHDPHAHASAHFLRTKPDTLCATCHAQQTTLVNGPHDFQSRPELRNGTSHSPAETGTCGFCHAVHDAKGVALWNATPDAPTDANSLCLNCHQVDSIAHAPAKLRHPTGRVSTTGKALTVAPHHPPQPADDLTVELSCANCHNPHAAWKPDSTSMMRAEPGAPAHQVCVQCHAEAALIQMNPHGHLPSPLSNAQPSACASCHAVHERPAVPGDVLWSMPLASEERCTTCHRTGGDAQMPHYIAHLPLLATNITASGEGFMPLVDANGRPGPTGMISCVTCHIPHGRPPGGGYDPYRVDHFSMLSGQKMMLRPYVTPNLCSSCHGFDGLRRFLYFHSAKSRTAAAPNPTE